jgi:uncharacterized protein (DUF433 family)
MNWELCKAVDRDPEKLGGKWCFAETRMPVAELFKLLSDGVTIEEFLEWFPEVSAEQVHDVLAFAQASLDQPAAA